MDPYGNHYPWYQTTYNPHVYIPPRSNAPHHKKPSGFHFLHSGPAVHPAPVMHPGPVDRTEPKYPQLNPALAADTTHIRYDVRKAPRDGILLSTYQQIGLQYAFAQPTSDLRIISKAFPWTIDIRAPSGSVVTCSAVFEALYAMLQEPIADSEWGIVVNEKVKKEVIEKAGKSRQEKDKDKRLKRIDWLGETTAFKGLDRDEEFEKKRLLPGTQGCKETWVIKFGKP